MHDLNATDGIRCLQQLGGVAPATASAASIALQEGFAPESAREILESLSRAGFVERTDGDRYRLARPPEAIRVSEVLTSFGSAERSRPGLTLADLLRFESILFAGETVARAA